MTDSLKEKVAIVTGGPWAIGEALCRELARRSARVAVIPDGVAYDKALIVFPASMRWARRASYF
jgi:NAD(P)-dependent dehydrogenase (short-subunit alcohol dehydrogenase family)